MKKVFLFIIAVAIVCSMGIMSFATGNTQISEYLHPGVYVSSSNEYFINGETVSFLIDFNHDEDYGLEHAEIYIDCNKDVLVYTGDKVFADKEFTVLTVNETDSGYVVTYDFDTVNGYEIFASVNCDFMISGNASPAVKITSLKKYAGEEIYEAETSVLLPSEKVYEREEIPHIVAQLGAIPAFGYGVTFNEYQEIFVCSEVTISQFSSILSSSDGKSEVRYFPSNSITRANVASGDVFAIEFDGKYSDWMRICVKGDVDSDGDVTASDARHILRYSAGLEVYPRYYEAGDVNNDKEITAQDARMILRVAADLDIFSCPDVVIWQNQKFKLGPLLSASDGGYLWRCTVSDEDAIIVTEIIEPSVDNTGKDPMDIIVGAHALQTFYLQPVKQGRFEVRFELIRSWETMPLKEFRFTVVTDDVLQ